MVFSILNFLIKKLISEYSLEFGFTFLRFPRSLSDNLSIAHCSARAASTPRRGARSKCQPSCRASADGPSWTLAGASLALVFGFHSPVRLGSVFSLRRSSPVLSACQRLWWVLCRLLCLNWSGKCLPPCHDEENVDLWVFPFPPLSDLLSIYGVGRTAVVRHL